MDKLTSVNAVVDALGGTGRAARQLGMSSTAVSMWKARKSLPATTFLAITRKLQQSGKQADPALWGMIEPRDS